MADPKTDREFLRAYAQGGSESAFQALVERHLDLVFATVLRGVSDPGAAEEITQNVFVALGRKAAWLSGETSLAGWLHRTALLEVKRWWRGELRRRRREQTAVELGTVMKEEDSLLKALAGELDEGLLELREPDRQALLLRYFEGRSHREIGALLGAREDAVRMRIDKALDRLTQFFRRRGYSVPAVTTMATVLGAAAKAAPAGLAIAATRSALSAGGGGALTGLKPLLAKFMGLTKTQTAVLCVAVAAMPLAWEWNVSRMTQNRAAATRSRLEVIRSQKERFSAEIAGLRAESVRLDAALAEADKDRARYEAAALKLDDLKTRVRGLLMHTNYHWPSDAPYVRVPKTVVRSLNQLDAWPGTFTPSGALTAQAQELFGITAEEKTPVEQALANYWRGEEDLMTTSAYETNMAEAPTGRLTKTVIVPPLGQPLEALAEETRQTLADILGAEREQLLFAGWDQGAVQTYWPGNLIRIAEASQTFTVWVEPASGNQAPHCGASWRLGSDSIPCCGGWSVGGQGCDIRWGPGCIGSSSDSAGAGCLGGFPRGIAARFFVPWLNQFGATTPTQFYGE
jgi:RNA polymerase sigma factor (sigma-70 family)